MSSVSYPEDSTASASSGSTRSRVDLFLVVLAGLLWGTGGLAGAMLGRVAQLHPLAVATYRLAGGGLLMLAVLACTGRLRRPSAAVLRRVLAIGALVALYQAAYFASVRLVGVPVSTLVTLGSAPVLVLGVEALRSRRRPARPSVAAVGLAVLGLGLLVGSPGSVRGAALFAGIVLGLVSAVGFAVLTLVGRRPVVGLDAPTSIGLGFSAGAVLLGALCLPTVGLGFAPSLASTGLMAYFACVPTALAYGCYLVGLRGVSASSASVVAVLEPVTATVLGVVLLGDHLSVGGAIGAALLCLAAVTAGLGPTD